MDRHLRAEAERATGRRAQVFGDGTQPFAHDQFLCVPGTTQPATWALALSGGGIRSATFNLGVLQELARPDAEAIAGLPHHTRLAFRKTGGLLPQFDYISSVSGGGFLAGFVQALYAHQAGTPRQAAATVNAFIAQTPPPRVKAGVKPSPLAWLRENGRYLAPSGAGDMAYAFGFGVRNWLGIQAIVGAPLLLATALLALVAHAIAFFCPAIEFKWWWLPLAVLATWILPTAGAYWMTRDVCGPCVQPELPRRRLAYVLAAGAAALAAGGSWWLADLAAPSWLVADPGWFGTDRQWPAYLTLCGSVLVLAFVWALAVRYGGGRSPGTGELAVALTHACTVGIQTAGILLALALVLEIAHEVLEAHHAHPILVSGGGAGLLALIYRVGTKLVPLLRGAGSSLGKTRGIPRRALAAALSVLGFVLVFGLAVFWTAAAQWLMAPSGPEPWASWQSPDRSAFGALARTPIASAGMLALLAAVFTVVAGRWASILNTSSYSHFYSSRLTRAYLGAANPNRTTAGVPTEPAVGKAARKLLNVADFAPGDAVPYDTYHASAAAPLHLINATLNQTVDVAEQLVQRDRKGRQFTVLPWLGRRNAKRSVAVAIDGEYARVTGEGATLTIGDWMAVSGAAVSTGMGRQTSAGAAVCVTFANARIGRWWEGRFVRDRLLYKALPTYAYLFDEMRARFHGTQRRRCYLTDGGHFDNTATYELLRRVRNRDTALRFILMCDCGADAEYRYDDLANLVRLARVDFELEVEVDDQAHQDKVLGKVFGTPSTMGAADPANLDTRCAILLNVRHGTVLVARIVVIKPRLIACASSDLLAYYRNNPVFPQQTTGDQFFDDEQWESYRRLGAECCRVVLNLGQAFWKAVL